MPSEMLLRVEYLYTVVGRLLRLVSQSTTYTKATPLPGGTLPTSPFHMQNCTKRNQNDRIL